MTTVDPEGRARLPKEIRERLNLTPGTEVVVREEDGKAVVKPAVSPDKILERMDQLVKETAPNQGSTVSPLEEAGSRAHKHKDAVQRGAENHRDE